MSGGPRRAGCELRLDLPGPSRESGERDERVGAEGGGEAGTHPSRPGSIRPRTSGHSRQDHSAGTPVGRSGE